jgi:Raf kinase inhibitor-like YbhB/YbcL family protein
MPYDNASGNQSHFDRQVFFFAHKWGYTLWSVLRMTELLVKSPAFKNNELIPPKYTCDGQDINPPLIIEGLPKMTKSLVLIIEDPDAAAGVWDHWVVWNIPPTNRISENSVPGTEGANSFHRRSYGGPCPPSGTHRYYFKIYALDTELGLGEGSSKGDLERAIKAHIISKGQLLGLYHRTR